MRILHITNNTATKVLSKNISERKDWIIKGGKTDYRGTVLLADIERGFIVGYATLKDVCELDTVDFIMNERHHRVPVKNKHNRLPYERTWAWVLQDAYSFKDPIPYVPDNKCDVWGVLRQDTLPVYYINMVREIQNA